MSKAHKRKVISVGDYVKKIDSVEFVVVPEGEIPIRIKRPSPHDSLVIMEMVQKASAEGMEEALSGKEVEQMDVNQRIEMLRFSYDYDATLISSCCFHPKMAGDEPDPAQDENARKIWETKDDVLHKCSTPLYNGLRDIIKGTNVSEQITQGEASK